MSMRTKSKFGKICTPRDQVDSLHKSLYSSLNGMALKNQAKNMEQIKLYVHGSNTFNMTQSFHFSAKPKANQSAEERQQDTNNGDYEPDFEEDDEKSASENVGKGDDLSDNISLASYVSEGDYFDNNDNNDNNDNHENKVDDNNNNKVDDSSHNSNNRNDASADNNQHHIDTPSNFSDDSGSVNFSDDCDDLLKIIPDTGKPSASAKEQGTAKSNKSVLSTTEPNKSLAKEEPTRNVTFNNDEQIQDLSKNNSFDESSNDEDFGGGYVPSFAGKSMEPKPNNAKEQNVPKEMIVEEFEEDGTDATPMAKQRTASSGKNGI